MNESLAATGDMRHVTTFCGNCDCGCPELFVDDEAPPERRVVLTDDFGQLVQMSVAQLKVLVTDVKAGALDEVVTAVV